MANKNSKKDNAESIFENRRMSEDEIDDVILDIMIRAGTPPVLIYAYLKTGRIITEGNQKYIPKRDLEKWSEAFKEFEENQVIFLNNLTHDEEADNEEYAALALFDGKIKLVSLLPDGSYKFIDGTYHFHNTLYIVSSETTSYQEAVEQLEELINNPSSKEHDFQKFFEDHPEFILNDEYKAAHSHIALTVDNEQTLIPDFVLEPMEKNGLCDLLEIKLPASQAFVLKKSRARFSAAVTEARAQLLEYSLFFDESKNRDLIYQKYGLKAWKPKMFVIIGRLGQVDPMERRKMEIAEPGLCLRTYDEVINRMKFKIERMKQNRRG